MRVFLIVLVWAVFKVLSVCFLGGVRFAIYFLMYKRYRCKQPEVELKGVSWEEKTMTSRCFESLKS